MNLFGQWIQERADTIGYDTTDRKWAAQLAKAAGISYPVFGFIVFGEATRPNPDQCVGLAKALKLDPTTVLAKAGHPVAIVDTGSAEQIREVLRVELEKHRAWAATVGLNLEYGRSVATYGDAYGHKDDTFTHEEIRSVRAAERETTLTEILELLGDLQKAEDHDR